MHNSIKQQINVIAESWAYFGPDPQFKGQSVRHNCGSCGAEITFSSMNIAVVKDETCDKCEQLVTYWVESLRQAKSAAAGAID